MEIHKPKKKQHIVWRCSVRTTYTYTTSWRTGTRRLSQRLPSLIW